MPDTGPTLPISSQRGWLDAPRRVGSPRHWSKHAGLLGVVLGWLVPASATITLAALSGDGIFWGGLFMLAPFHTMSAVAGGAAGALLGLVEPAVLDSLRGRLPVPAIGALQAIPGALAGGAAGAAWGGLLLLFVGEPALAAVGIFSAIGATFGALAALLWWLPFTVATVVGHSGLARAVTGAVGVGFPALVALLMFLLML